jgi:hypothetical protein
MYQLVRGRSAPQKEDLRQQAIEMGLLPRHARGQGQGEGQQSNPPNHA